MLLPAALPFQLKMSFVSPFAISAMNLTASTVFFERIVGWLSSFWMKLPKHIMKAISAMFESISCDWPIADRMADRLQLRRRRLDVVPRRRRLADAVPEVVPPDHRVGHVAVRDREVLLRLRVVGRRLRDRHVLADLRLDLVDDRRVVDHLVLVRGHRVEVEEQVVPLLGRHLRGRARVEQAVVDVLDRDLDVVLLAPRLRPRVEPLVVGGDEVHPRERASGCPRASAPCT